ncbi:azurin [Puniceicoccaceae bacterium K14]|nr:azurin [Puniceicoccaceae bacterium K14]
MKKLLTAFGFIAVFAASSLVSAKTIEVTSNDTMKFNVSEIETEVGVETTLTLINEGKIPKAAMGHNLVILKPGADLASFGNAAVTAAANDYIPTAEDMAALIIANTKVLGPGESDTIVFTIDEPGNYPFICSFPGHWALMKGILTVK